MTNVHIEDLGYVYNDLPWRFSGDIYFDDVFDLDDCGFM